MAHARALPPTFARILPRMAAVFALVLSVAVSAVPNAASAQQVTALMQSIAEAASKSKDLSEFYRATGYQPLFCG